MTSFAQSYRRALLQPILLVIWVTTSLFGVIAGPFGTLEAMPLATRACYWPLLIAIGIAIGAFLRVTLQQRLGLRSYAAEAPALALFATLLLTPPFWLITCHLAGPSVTPSWGNMALYIFFVSIATSTLRHALAAMPHVPLMETPPEAEPDPPGPRLLARLEPTLRAPLVRMQVRDHYVDVVTDAGSDSLLLRLADAIAETEGEPGLQVHRSHWVALRAVVALHRGRGKVVLRMRDGAVVPVSRTYLAEVEALALPEAGREEMRRAAE